MQVKVSLEMWDTLGKSPCLSQRMHCTANCNNLKAYAHLAPCEEGEPSFEHAWNASVQLPSPDFQRSVGMMALGHLRE